MRGARALVHRAGALVAALLLAACASRPPAPLPADRDGPDARPPSGLERLPDAEPRIEPLRSGGPNKPYEVFGQTYVPLTADLPLRESGGASWYGRKFHGKPTSSGETYDMYAMTAAHKTMPIPSYARVRNPANGREIVVRINDRGPFAPGRVIDLSYTAALKLGLLNGVAPVEVERITHAEIRAGLAVRVPPTVAAAAPAPAPAPASAAVSNSIGLPDDLVPSDLVAGQRSDAVPAAGWWLQLGAFRLREAAAQLQGRLQQEEPDLAFLLVADGDLHRLQAGPWGTRAQADAVARRLRAQRGLDPLLLQRR